MTGACRVTSAFGEVIQFLLRKNRGDFLCGREDRGVHLTLLLKPDGVLVAVCSVFFARSWRVGDGGQGGM